MLCNKNSLKENNFWVINISSLARFLVYFSTFFYQITITETYFHVIQTFFVVNLSIIFTYTFILYNLILILFNEMTWMLWTEKAKQNRFSTNKYYLAGQDLYLYYIRSSKMYFHAIQTFFVRILLSNFYIYFYYLQS